MSDAKQKLVKVATYGVLAVGFVFAASSIYRAVTAGPATVPRKGDLVKAERLILPQRPGGDPKVESPEGDLLAGNGVVEPYGKETKVAAAVPGVVAAVFVQEGERVEAGKVMLELGREPEKAALVSAEAGLGQAQAELAKVTAGSRPEEIDAAEREAGASKARADLSQRVLARLEPLGASGAATGDEVDRARLLAAADLEASKAAAARAALVHRGSRSEDVALARAKVVTATAQREEALVRFERLLVKAPSGGVVLQVKFRIGEYYQPTGVEPLFVLGDTTKLRVRMDLDERDVGRVTTGSPAFVTADAFPGRRFNGKVGEIGHRMGRKNVRSDDPIERIDTKILEVLIDLDDSKDLLPGLRVLAYASAKKD